MNKNNTAVIIKSLPQEIAPAINDRSLVRRRIGRSGNRGYAVGQDLYLKISPGFGELRRERDMALWPERRYGLFILHESIAY